MDKINNIINDSNIEQNIPAIPAMHILRCNRQIVRDWSQAVPVRPHWRIYWNQSPGAVVSDNFQKYHLNSSFILVIPPAVHIKQTIISPCESLFIHADIDMSVAESVNRIFTIDVSLDLQECLTRLSKNLTSPFIIGEFVYAVMSRLPDTVIKERIEDTRIRNVCRELHNAPEKAWNNRELAAIACFSENAFIRRFREVTGLAPQRYLQKLRLEKAASMLLKNEASIDEIATQCGFCDRHYLTKLFSRQYGLSPARYRAGGNIP